MECHDVQRVVSEKCDDDQLADELIHEAREHCKVCPECASYVRVLAQIQRLPSPQAPEGLVEAIMSAVQAEPLPDAPVSHSASETAAPVVDEPVSPSAVGRFVAFLTEPRNRRAVAAWGAAAVVLIAVSTVTAVSGIRQIVGSESPALVSVTESVKDAPADTAAPLAEDGGLRMGEAAPAQPPSTIVVGSTVYRSGGIVSGVETLTMSPVGSTTSSLDTGGAPKVRDVVGPADPSRVYVVNDAGELLGFEVVSREIKGRTYVLTSATLPTFGRWPTLPVGVVPPSNPDGSPQYVESGTDALGVVVHRPATGDTHAGFMIAPGTSSSDPAAGNPGWTWWVPAR